MRIPGYNKYGVQSLGRRDTDIGHSSTMRKIAMREKGEAEKEKALQYTRKARQEDLRGAGADFDTFRQDVAIAKEYFRGGMAVAAARSDEARATGAMWQGIGDTVIGIGGIIQQVQNKKQEVKNQQQEADFRDAMFEWQTNWDSQYGGRNDIDSKELTGSVDTDANKARGSVPSAEVMPTMYKESVFEAIQAAAVMVEDPELRDQLVREAAALATKNTVSLDIASNKYQEAQYLTSEMNKFNAAVDSSQYNLAQSILNGLPDSVDKTEHQVTIDKGRETDGYQNMKAENNEGALMEASRFLSQPYEDYRKAGGNLNPDERLSALSGVEAELNRMQSAREGGVKADYSRIKRHAREAKSGVAQGTPYSDKQLMEIHQELISSYGEPGGANLADIDDFEVTMEASRRVAMLSAYGPEDREARMESFRTELEGDDFTRHEVYSIMQSAHENLVAAERKDMISAARAAGHEISEISYASPQEMHASLSRRAVEFETMYEVYGVEQGLLDKSEAMRMSQQLNQMPASDRLRYYAIINDSVGTPHANKIFDQLNMDGIPSSAAMAGELFSSGYEQVAETISQGADFRASNQDELSGIDSDLKDAIIDRTATLFPNNPTRQSSVKQAINDAYVGLTIGNRDAQAFVDDDILDQAKRMVVGETMEQGGNEIVTPRRDMTEDQFFSWMSRVPDNFLDGQVRSNYGSLSASEIRESIVDGRYELRPAGPGMYQVWALGSPLQSSLHDGAWILEYDDTLDLSTTGGISSIGRPRPATRGQR